MHFLVCSVTIAAGIGEDSPVSSRDNAQRVLDKKITKRSNLVTLLARSVYSTYNAVLTVFCVLCSSAGLSSLMLT